MKPLPKWLHYPLILGGICAASGALLAFVYQQTEDEIRLSGKVKAMEAIASVAFHRTLDSTRRTTRKGSRLTELLDEDGAAIGHVEEAREKRKPGVLYIIYRPNMSLVGYGAVAPGPGSYSSMDPVKILTVLGPKLERLIGARVVESAETPGLGEKAKEQPASTSIVGLLIDAPRRELVVTKEGECFRGEVTVEDDGSVVVRTADEKEYTFAPGECWREPRAPEFMAQFSGLVLEEALLVRDGGKVDAMTGATVTSTAITRAVSDAAARLESKFGESQ